MGSPPRPGGPAGPRARVLAGRAGAGCTVCVSCCTRATPDAAIYYSCTASVLEFDRTEHTMQRLGHVVGAVIQRSPAAANSISPPGKLGLNTTVELRDGGKIPIFGLGTWRAESGGECREACDAALKTGYQLLDTASGYNNEEDVGAAIAESGRSRDQIYVVTKHSGAHGYAETLAACDA